MNLTDAKLNQLTNLTQCALCIIARNRQLARKNICHAIGNHVRWVLAIEMNSSLKQRSAHTPNDQAQRQPPGSAGGAQERRLNHPRLSNGKRGGCSPQPSGRSTSLTL